MVTVGLDEEKPWPHSKTVFINEESRTGKVCCWQRGSDIYVSGSGGTDRIPPPLTPAFIPRPLRDPFLLGTFFLSPSSSTHSST
jgi:hypothetical protein